MSLVDFIRLLLRHLKLLVAVPLVMAVTVFGLTWGQPREYESRTSIYTGLVSGYTIESGQGTRTDYLQVNSSFDNLINLVQSRETIEQVALGLMAMQLEGKLDVREVDLSTPLAHLAGGPSRTVSMDEEGPVLGGATFARLVGEVSDTDGPVYALLYRQGGPFNVDELSRRLSVRRVGVSDMVEMRFTAHDPVLARTTLDLVSSVFMARHKTMRRREASTVLDYFSREVERAQGRLAAAVDRVREFGTRNRVINYYEQTKYIASQKESIDQQIQDEEMKLAAAESAVKELERKIGMTDEILRRNAAMLERRRGLAELTSQMVHQEATGTVEPAIQARLTEERDSLTQDIVELYRANYSKEGLAKGELVTEWLDNLIVATETRAALDVLRNRRDTYQTTYDEFSPLGATLSSLEREVDIAESEYMELLHSLNLARMRQQNIELAANLEVVDAPTFPEHPLPSKAMLLVALAMMAGVTLTVAGVVAGEYLDGTIRTPERSTRLTGLPLGGALPLLAGATSDVAAGVAATLSTQLLRNLRLHLSDRPEANPAVVAVAGSRGAEGKTLVAGRLVRLLRAGGTDVTYASHSASLPDQAALEIDAPDTVYTVDARFGESENLDALGVVPASGEGASRFLFLELPHLMGHELPLRVLRNVHAALFVVRANQVWTEADARALEAFRRALGYEPLIVLNGVRLERVECLVGEVPKRRSRLRRFGKRLAQFNFGS